MVRGDERVEIPVHRVVPVDELQDNVHAWAVELAERATLSLAATKRAMRYAESATYQDAFRTESYEQHALRQTHDASEGVEAFIEKRKPAFTGS